ncbi:MAG: exodeoxyribonuclease large subunit, partial [Thermoleophilaceae bacterium]|nr:exodeoxyribonuclease large subunit [Thermoleophilaceae bacterium]
PAAEQQQTAGIPGFPGPFEVGRYAHQLRDQLRGFTRVALVGEVLKVRIGNGPQVYFELRDREGALPCAMWRNEFDRCGMKPEDLRDGIEVVAAGGCDFYPGSATASPGFTFRVNELRPAGEGDLLARLDRLRRQLASEGLFEPQKQLRIAALPRTIGVVTAQGSAACRDFLAALERRGWSGRIVWGYAPVQDRRAAGAITKAISDLALLEEVETIVVTRGGGSIADLWAFCDESLCRTVALLAKPVISAVGHEVDRTLIDDVSAASCSTPTHAAEVAVRIDCRAARERLVRDATRLDAAGRGAVVTRARHLAALSRAPRDHVARHKRELHQKAREIRAASGRQLDTRAVRLVRIAGTVLARKIAAALASARRSSDALRADAHALDRASARLTDRRAETLGRLTAALAAHDPQRTLERGYALALGADGEPLPTAAAIREAGEIALRMADGVVPATVQDSDPDER